MQCLILAGGLATRMRPITDAIPKALIPVGGKPFIDHQLKWLAHHGVTRVVLSLGYHGAIVQDFVGDGSRWSLSIKYVCEGAELRGTAGALRLALDENALESSFLVTYGDSFLPINFQEVWDAFLRSKLPALMTVYKNFGQWDSSNVLYRGDRVLKYDKLRRGPDASQMEFIDYGLLAFKRELIETLIPPHSSGKKSDLAEILDDLSTRGQLAGFEAKARFYEIGSPQGLQDFEKLVRSGEFGILS